MTWRQIESSREARLWVTQVIAPVVIIGGAFLAAVESECHTFSNGFKKVGNKITNFFKKKEEKNEQPTEKENH